jgi:hypothetical protein
MLCRGLQVSVHHQGAAEFRVVGYGGEAETEREEEDGQGLCSGAVDIDLDIDVNVATFIVGQG